MTAKNKLVKELIRSLSENCQEWTFSEYTAENKKYGIKLWLSNFPFLGASVWLPTEISFGIFDGRKIYKAADECRSLWVISKMS